MSKSNGGGVGGEEAGEEKKTSRDNHRASGPKRYLAFLAAGVAAIINCFATEREQQQAEKTWDRKWRKLEVGGIWAAASVGLVAIIWSGIDSRRQLDEMQAEQRAWVSADVAINGPLEMAPNGNTSVVVSLALKNVGHGLARGVFYNIDMIVPKSGKEYFAGPKVFLAEMCKTHMANTPTEFNLFPDQREDAPTTLSVLGQDVHRATNSGGMLKLVIIGCVNYQLPNSTKPHRTSFIYEIYLRDKESPGQPFGLQITPVVPLDGLMLIRWPFFGGEAT